MVQRLLGTTVLVRMWDRWQQGDLLTAIEPNFEWIRLAQRVPVRVHLDPLPEDIYLRVGTTASVLIHTGTAAAEK